MGVYVYCIREDHAYKTAIKGREFENAWFKDALAGYGGISGKKEKK
jgi:hypothetical protein